MLLGDFELFGSGTLVLTGMTSYVMLLCDFEVFGKNFKVAFYFQKPKKVF